MSNNELTFQMVDTTLNTLEQALRVCGLPLTLSQDSFRVEGSGAWHDAYRVSVPQHAHPPFIVRIRKPIAYGQTQEYAESAMEWHAEYTAAGLYYRQANRALPGICPSVFLYNVSPEITCTVESYMGQRLDLANLNKSNARRFGAQIGSMMRVMHQKKTHITGTGELAWDGANLFGVAPRHHPALMRKIEQSYNENILLALTEEGPAFNHNLAWQKLNDAHAIRDVDEPIVLINRDITPENLTVQNGYRIGIIDPFPYLGNGTRFAAWFIHCYRFLLPAYADTERYKYNRYDEYAKTLSYMADGFERGYIQGDYELARHIAAERWLWILEQAYNDYELLTMPELSERIIMKHGTPEIIRTRLQKALRQMETLEF